MWKLFIFTFLCLVLRTSCDDDTSGDVKKTQIATAAVKVGSSSDGSSESVAAVAKITTVKTDDKSDPPSGSGNGSNSSSSPYDDGGDSGEDDDDDNCNEMELDDDYDCTSAMPRVERAIIKISFIRKNNFLKNNFLNYNNYCNINQTQLNEGHIGSPLATWYILAMITIYTEDNSETLNELLHYLGLENKDECGCVMKKMRRSNKALFKDLYAYITFILADYKFTELFKRDVIQYLDGKALNCNFNRSQTCARKLNKIAAAKSRNLFVDLVSKKEASSVINASQVYVNVVGTYLKPVFKMSFNTENKTRGMYYGLNEPIIAEYWQNSVVIFNSTESRTLNARLILIPLKTNNTNLLVMLPNTRCALQPMVAKLASEPQILQDEMKCLKRTCMNLTIPDYKDFTTVVNVVPALQSTCEINRVFDERAQIIDSCGKPLNTYISYIHEKSTGMFSAIGDEPYEPASANDCSDCGEPIDVCINYPAVFLYFVNGVCVEGVIAPVVNAGPYTNE